MRFRKQKPDQYQRRRLTTPTTGGFSYYSKRKPTVSTSSENTGRNYEKSVSPQRKSLPLGYLPSYIALIAVVVALSYALWLQPSPRISLVSQPGTIHQDNALYQEEIERLWRKSLLNQTKLTVKTQTLKNDILERFSELADVHIELPLLGRRPAVTLVPAKPAMQLVSGNGIYYVSSSGRVMAKTADIRQNQLNTLPLVRDETGLQAEVGKIVIPEPQAVFLEQLYAQLVSAKLTVQSITLPSSAANEADVRLADKKYFIKFSTEVDPRQGVGTYLAAVSKFTADGITPSEYIDVRVEEKVFYR